MEEKEILSLQGRCPLRVISAYSTVSAEANSSSQAGCRLMRRTEYAFANCVMLPVKVMNGNERLTKSENGHSTLF